jgi:hypothetical protein
LSEIESSGASLSFIDGSLLVIFGFLELSIELSKFGIELPDDLLNFIELDSGNLQLLLSFLQLLPKWTDFLDDVVKLDDIEHP